MPLYYNNQRIYNLYNTNSGSKINKMFFKGNLVFNAFSKDNQIINSGLIGVRSTGSIIKIPFCFVPLNDRDDISDVFPIKSTDITLNAVGITKITIATPKIVEEYSYTIGENIYYLNLQIRYAAQSATTQVSLDSIVKYYFTIDDPTTLVNFLDYLKFNSVIFPNPITLSSGESYTVTVDASKFFIDVCITPIVDNYQAINKIKIEYVGSGGTSLYQYKITNNNTQSIIIYGLNSVGL